MPHEQYAVHVGVQLLALGGVITAMVLGIYFNDYNKRELYWYLFGTFIASFLTAIFFYALASPGRRTSDSYDITEVNTKFIKLMRGRSQFRELVEDLFWDLLGVAVDFGSKVAGENFDESIIDPIALTLDAGLCIQSVIDWMRSLRCVYFFSMALGWFSLNAKGVDWFTLITLLASVAILVTGFIILATDE